MSNAHTVRPRLFSREDSAPAKTSVTDLRPIFPAVSARLFESAQLRYRWTAATSELTTEFLAATNPDTVLCRVVERVRELSDSDRVWVATSPDSDVPADEVTELVITQWAGAGAQHGRRIPVTGPVAEAFRGSASVTMPAAGDIALFGDGPVLVLPLHTGATALGVVAATRGGGQPPYPSEITELCGRFTGQAALALHLARAQQRLRELDVFADRDRIARDLHDHVIQRVFAIGLSLQGTIGRTHHADVRRQLCDAVDDLQEVITDIRSSVYDLHAGPHRTRLRQRLIDIVRQQTEHSDMQVTTQFSGPLDAVPVELADHAEAVVQETISNAVRHSHAAILTITVIIDDALTITVEDNGTGIPSDLSPSGLSNLAARARNAGGHFDHCPATRPGPHGPGTRTTWNAPMP